MIYGKTHIHKVTVDFDLLDAGNVLYHPNYLVLCERARHAAIGAAGYPNAEMWADGYALALGETNSKYVKPAMLGQPLWISSTIMESGGASMKVYQRMFKMEGGISEGFTDSLFVNPPGETVYELTVKLVCVKLNPVKSTRFPARLVEALKLPGKGSQGGQEDT